MSVTLLSSYYFVLRADIEPHSLNAPNHSSIQYLKFPLILEFMLVGFMGNICGG